MRISVLQKREPFYNILEKTLENYFSKRYGVPYIVRVKEKHAVRKVSSKNQVWYCNPYLNIIFCPTVKPEPLLPAVYEFSRSAKPWRTPLNRCYVTLATWRRTSRFMATSTIEIAPPVPNAEDIVIIGGNHHIRLLDYGHGSCTVIKKSGSSDELMKNEIAVRCIHPHLPAPQLIEQNESGEWYREKLILGTPINRLKDRQTADEALKRIVQSLLGLYGLTKATENINDYVSHLIERVQLYIRQNRLLSESQRDTVHGIVQKLACISNKTRDEIILVQTHGDFQPGNILLGDGGPWLIDWEYTNRRQIGYDAIVYALETRHSKGLAHRMARTIDGTINLDGWFESWPGFDWNDCCNRKAKLGLFLLEELLLKLMENDNDHFFALDYGFICFFNELQSIIPILEK